jgi:7-cyano-7-deazaguanine synthase in queuosine biosynthesis
MKILVAFSGGVESTALMYWAREQTDKVIAYHWSNTGPRTGWEGRFVEMWCKEHNVPLIKERSLFDDSAVRNDRSDRVLPLLAYWFPHLTMAACRIEGLTHVVHGKNADFDNPGDLFVKVNPFAMAVWDKVGLGHLEHTMPLGDFTKKQQYEMIPKVWRDRIVKCFKGPGQPPCGECYKCLEYKQTGLFDVKE